MAESDARQKAGHPSPRQHRVKLWALLFGLTGGPGAWLVASLASVILAQEACYPHATPLSTPAFGGVHPTLIALEVIAIAVTIISGAVSYDCWIRTRAEHPARVQSLLEIGEGRSRFMAMGGMLTSGGFLIAILFAFPGIAFVPVC